MDSAVAVRVCDRVQSCRTLSRVESEPFQYHAPSEKPFRTPSTEIYGIEKVKPLHGTIVLLGHH